MSARARDGDPGLEEQVRELPTEPGVYLFKGADDRVLYVGKAQSLRARVRSYFVKGGDGRHQVHFLVPRIRDLEVVVTSSVKEALLLENQLIKKHRPRFNVRLRDDKNYLALRLDPTVPYPRFTETRRFQRDRAVYFGPYTSSGAMRETLSTLQRMFPLRTCSDAGLESYRRRGRPCIEHSIGRCVAPCCRLISDRDYRNLVDGAVLFLRGRSRELIGSLKREMDDSSAREDFEVAARLRDRIDAIERTVEQQSMVSRHFVDRDVFGLARDDTHVEVQVLYVRQGTLLGGDHHAFNNVRISDEEVLASFLFQFYSSDRELPREVLVPEAIEACGALAELWSERSGRAVRLIRPQRGERRRLLEMAGRNARLALAERMRRDRSSEETARELRQLLRLERPPRRIECYDISHLSGTLHVASRVVFLDGKPDKNAYRRYKLRESPPGDDYAAMREVLGRRLATLERDPPPDLILLDGGKGHLRAVEALLADLAIEGIPLAALAKERDGAAPNPRVLRHAGSKREKLFLLGVKDPILPDPAGAAMLFLQRLRDESHRFAIRYHRELRRKAGLRSILDEIPGVGPKKRRALLRGLGSLEAVKRASEDELRALAGISSADAVRIRRFLASLAGLELGPAAPEPGGTRGSHDPVE